MAVLAASTNPWDSCLQPIGGGGTTLPTVKCFEVIFNIILSSAVGIVVLILFIMLTIGGFKYLTSGSDYEKTEGAKKTMTYAIIGIALIAVSFLILKLIETFTGVNMTTFNIDNGINPTVTAVPTP